MSSVGYAINRVCVVTSADVIYTSKEHLFSLQKLADFVSNFPVPIQTTDMLWSQ